MWISFRCKSGGLVDHFWVQFNSLVNFVQRANGLSISYPRKMLSALANKLQKLINGNQRFQIFIGMVLENENSAQLKFI